MSEPQPVRSFAPVVGPNVSVLVLGSMPGVRSLHEAEYYAHPRNAFWPLMEDLLGVPRDRPYPQRLRALADRGVALWDVLASCVRPGSLDSNIVASSVVPNAIAPLLLEHRGIHRVLLNGGAADRAFRKHIVPELEQTGRIDSVELHRVPSTSPAHASVRYDGKRAAWAAALPSTLLRAPD